MGGFGNMLFQFMFGYSMARKNKAFLTFICNEKKRCDATKYNFLNKYNINKSINNEYIILKEMNHYYDEYKLNQNHNYYIIGFFQSYKYSFEYFEEIKEIIFNNLSEKINKIIPIYELIKDKKTTIGIHIRKTDYVELYDIHYIIRNDEWYDIAIKQLLKKINLNKDNIRLILFSDDINYLKKMEIFKQYDSVIAENYNLDIEETFLLMSYSDNFIISNSTYSLMAYYFRKNKNAKIVIPNKWFGIKGPKYKIEDIIEITENVIINYVNT
jgi:hypothetical protein